MAMSNAEHNVEILSVCLDNGFDPNERLADGSSLLDSAVKRRMVDHVHVLLIHGAETTMLSALQCSQLLGDALKVRSLILGGATSPMAHVLSKGSVCAEEREEERAEPASSVPALHRAALQDDDGDAIVQVRKELNALSSGEAARHVLDEGKLPALFYAVEVGNFGAARELLERAHGLQSFLVDRLIEACVGWGSLPSRAIGLFGSAVH